jgi:hypothetical protein
MAKLDQEIFRARATPTDSLRRAFEAGTIGVEGSPNVESFNVNRGRGAAAIDRAPWDVDLGRLGADDIVERAHRVLGAVESSANVPAEGFEKVTAMLTGAEATRAANWAVASSDPA